MAKLERWRRDVSAGVYLSLPLDSLQARDGLAVECAARLRMFHMDRDHRTFHDARAVALNPLNCFLLISWGEARKQAALSKLVIGERWRRERRPGAYRRLVER